MASRNEMPWSPRSRQKEGDRTEKKVIKDRGGRAHPRSGAGSIKWDGSTETELIEVKDANKTYSISADMLDKLVRDANSQGKDAVFIVNFQHKDVVLEAIVKRR